ncbi:hypothetical protein SLA2020_340060 [Shorea laevis]
MKKWPKPATLKAMRGFLGLTGYYRRFIQDYGKIAAPLNRMLKKNNFAWTAAVEGAFENLKEAMVQAPVLALPDFSKEFVVECDASGVGIGAVLHQGRPIAFLSRALQGAQLLLSTYEKEILALVMAVQKWRPYLLGRHFVVRSDHHSLKYLWSQKISTTAQQRWLYKLMGFDFSIEYKKGKENIVADALSRRDEKQGLEEKSSLVHSRAKEEKKTHGAVLVAVLGPVPNWLEVIKEEAGKDAALQELIQKVKEGEALGPWHYKGEVLFYKDRIYLPENSTLLAPILDQIHGGFHEGTTKPSKGSEQISIGRE